METITIIFFGLAALVLLMALVLVIAFYKPIGGDEYFKDETPTRYEDYEAIFYDP
jgi:hypothetical protein